MWGFAGGEIAPGVVHGDSGGESWEPTDYDALAGSYAVHRRINPDVLERPADGLGVSAKEIVHWGSIEKAGGV